MATNLVPIPPPLGERLVDDNGYVTMVWANFFTNIFRYQQPMWKDLNIGGTQLTLAAAGQPGKTTIAATSIIVYVFDGVNQVEELHGALELQHDYKEGTVLKPHIHWYATDANSGNVEWYMEYWFNSSNGIKTGSVSGIGAANGAWVEVKTVLTEIDGTDILAGTQLHLRVYRSPTGIDDTYDHDAAVATVGVHYQADMKGTNQVYVK